MKRILQLLGLTSPAMHAVAPAPGGEPGVAELRRELAELRRELRTLQDIEAIKRLKHAYFRGIDSADLPLLASLFHPDVDVHFVGGGYEWAFKGREQYVEAIGNSFHSEAVAQHNGHHPEITVLSETEAEGIWYLYDNFWELNQKIYTYGTAFYHDRYEKVDGRWLIRSTHYKRHYEVVTKMKDDQPRFTVRYLSSHGRVLPKP